MPQGQVLNVESGVNESLEGLEMEAFFQEFPDLREGSADDAGEERQQKRARSGSEGDDVADSARSEQELVEILQRQDSVAVLGRLLSQHRKRVAVHKAYDAAFRKCLERG